MSIKRFDHGSCLEVINHVTTYTLSLKTHHSPFYYIDLHSSHIYTGENQLGGLDDYVEYEYYVRANDWTVSANH